MPERVGRDIERCKQGIARLEKEIADLEHRRDHAPEICEQCDTRIAEITTQIEGIKRRSEVDKLRQQLTDAGLI
jgi:chromosome segregation ATPase